MGYSSFNYAASRPRRQTRRVPAAKIAERLLGNKPEERFNFISARAQFVGEEELDI
jgi:hypothetical protein